MRYLKTLLDCLQITPTILFVGSKLLFMGFKESCESIGGKIETAEDIDGKICLLEDKKMAITENGRTIPVD